MSAPDRPALARSYLYVPGDRPAWLERSLDHDADAVVLDLEDSVVAAHKEAARQAVREFLAMGSDGPQRWVRVNSDSDDALAADVQAVVCRGLTGLLLPSADVEVLLRLDSLLAAAERSAGLTPGRVAVVGLIETAAAVVRLADVARAPRLLRLGIGEADLAGQLGIEPDEERTELWPIRTAVVVASAAAGLARPIGPVHVRLDDADGLVTSTRAQLRQGFRARTAIHPSQVAAINEVFTPTAARVDAARRLLAEVERAKAAGRGALRGSDGQMHDPATVAGAREVLRGAADAT